MIGDTYLSITKKQSYGSAAHQKRPYVWLSGNDGNARVKYGTAQIFGFESEFPSLNVINASNLGC